MSHIDEIKYLLKDYLSSKPIVRAWVFGSYARGDYNYNSDIDILVDFDENNDLNLLSLADIILDLENILGKKIDLVDHQRIYADIAPFIENEKIMVYERG